MVTKPRTHERKASAADSTPSHHYLEKINEQIEREIYILAHTQSSRESTNEINPGVACFLLRDVGRRAERQSQRNDIIRDDPNRFFQIFTNVFGTLMCFYTEECERERHLERNAQRYVIISRVLSDILSDRQAEVRKSSTGKWKYGRK